MRYRIMLSFCWTVKAIYRTGTRVEKIKGYKAEEVMWRISVSSILPRQRAAITSNN